MERNTTAAWESGVMPVVKLPSPAFAFGVARLPWRGF
jgi:hypothetical protein